MVGRQRVDVLAAPEVVEGHARLIRSLRASAGSK